MTFEKIQAIIVDQLGKEEEEVQLTTRLKDELDADSLDLFQIINDIEDEFDVKIDTEEGLETVQDLVNYVDKQLAEKYAKYLKDQEAKADFEQFESTYVSEQNRLKSLIVDLPDFTNKSFNDFARSMSACNDS